MINETDYTNNPLTKEQEAKIDEIFVQLDTADKPGCAIGVIQDGRFIYKKSFGMANLDNDIPINSKSKFKIGSVTKEFTVSCIALLAMEGKLDLDDEVRKYIPELPDYGKSITIRHLIYHTSGLRDYANLLLFAGFDFESSYDNKFVKRMIFRQKELDFDPGEMYSYSNSGYLLLADIVHLVTGKSLKEYADEKIFKPLDMKDTFFVSDRKEVIKNKVIPYNIQNGEISYFIHSLEPIGAGNIYSTIDDFIKWENNFNDPKVGGKEFLQIIQKKGYLNNNDVIEDYGLGFMHGTHNGRKWLGHGGAYYGFRCFHMRIPDFNTSMILMANREDVNEWGKCHQISDILLKPSIIVNTSIEKNKTIPAEYKLNLPELEKFCGHYWCEKERLNRKIYIKEEKLFYWREENNESQLVPVSSNELFMEGVPEEVKLSFDFNSAKKSIRLSIDGRITSEFINYEPTVFGKEYLRRFIGKFYSDELDVVHEIKLESDRLVLFMNDVKISEINGIVSDFFEIPKWDSFIKFKYNDLGIISGFIFNSSRIKRMEFTKLD